MFFVAGGDVDEQADLAPFEGNEAMVELLDIGSGLFDEA